MAAAQRIASLTDRPKDLAQVAQLIQVPDIDEGEALLFATVSENPTFLLTTGDKRSLTALAKHDALRPLCQAVAGRVLCLETVLKILVSTDGVAVTAQAFQTLVPTNKTLQVVFSEANRADQDQCLQCLDSYLKDLANQLGPDFLYHK